MFRKYSIVFILFLSVSAVGQSQKENFIAIQETIQNYYDGYIYRDIKKLHRAFDTVNGVMKVPVSKNGKVVGFENRFFKDVLPKWGNRKPLGQKILKNCALQILSVDMVDNQIASAKISMQVDSVTYIDILSLHKIQKAWKITNKMYVVRKTDFKAKKEELAKAKVALQFANDYIENCNKMKESIDILSWTNKYPLATKNLKSALKQVLEKGRKEDAEVGLGYDPFFKAQDWPSEGFELYKVYQNHVTVQGKNWKDFKMTLRLTQENGKILVDGVGVVNMKKR